MRQKLLSPLFVPLLSLFALGCANPRLVKVSADKPFSVQLKGQESAPNETQHYYSATTTTKFERGELIKKEEEIVDFDLLSKYLGLHSDGKGLVYEFTVKNKEGVSDLHAMAFPEEDETIKFIFSPSYEVLFAGRFPSNSIFFVPPISLPIEEVKVGDTWSYSRPWNGLYNGLPLKIDIVSILKGIYKCPDQNCAVIEVNARVKILGHIAKITRFNSLIRGQFLLGLNDATIYWSSLNSEEMFATPESRSEVKSCIVSYLNAPKEKQLGVKKATCDYNLDTVPELPKF